MSIDIVYLHIVNIYVPLVYNTQYTTLIVPLLFCFILYIQFIDNYFNYN